MKSLYINSDIWKEFPASEAADHLAGVTSEQVQLIAREGVKLYVCGDNMTKYISYWVLAEFPTYFLFGLASNGMDSILYSWPKSRVDDLQFKVDQCDFMSEDETMR